MSTDTPSVTVVSCSFCGKSQDEVKQMLAGPSAFDPTFFICDGCVALCAAIVDEGNEPPSVTVTGTLEYDEHERWWHVVLNTRPDRDLDIETGDEVEVTLRKHERTTGSAMAQEEGEMDREVEAVDAKTYAWRAIDPKGEPTAEDLESPAFKAIWEAIKGWDIQRRRGDGYAGATGTDVMTILHALRNANEAAS